MFQGPDGAFGLRAEGVSGILQRWGCGVFNGTAHIETLHRVFRGGLGTTIAKDRAGRAGVATHGLGNVARGPTSALTANRR